ncbi:hypothetical protein ACIHAA_03240 [Streptomyces sp. NPDC052040]|uniref:hypothetical protein n=1 Tax=unclassified Streptomyces TaxID=2593676 RepID=UPI0037D5F078
MATRSTVVTAALAAGAALVATGITYANAASEPAQAAAVAAPAPAAAPAAGAPAAPVYPQGNSGNGNNNGNSYGDNSKGNEGRDHDNDNEDNDHKGHYEGRVYINEREYSAHDNGCITVVSGLGANSLNVRNDSKKVVEVFSGATCDNGSPIATVGPHSSSNGLFPRHIKGGVKVKHGVVGSFRVVHRDGYGRGDKGGYDD